MSARAGILLAFACLTSAGCIFPRWPVNGPLVSPFGIRFQGIRPTLHRGVDVGVPVGTEVRAMARGTVRFVGTMRGYGTVVWIDHPGHLISVYAHLTRALVREGEEVRTRQVVALSGRSGNAGGPHLHFEVWRRGREIDPVPFLGGFPPGGS